MRMRPLLLWMSLIALASSLLCAQEALLTAKPPLYPLAAKAAGIQGIVKLKGTISSIGKVEDLRVLSGPPELRQAAIDSVSSYKYWPHTQNGQPIAIDTTFIINFDMGHGKKKAEAQAEAQAKLAKANQLATDPNPAPKN